MTDDTRHRVKAPSWAQAWIEPTADGKVGLWSHDNTEIEEAQAAGRVVLFPQDGWLDGIDSHHAQIMRLEQRLHQAESHIHLLLDHIGRLGSVAQETLDDVNTASVEEFDAGIY